MAKVKLTLDQLTDATFKMVMAAGWAVVTLEVRLQIQRGRTPSQLEITDTANKTFGLMVATLPDDNPAKAALQQMLDESIPDVAARLQEGYGRW